MKNFATLLLCLSASSAFAQFGYLDATSSIQTQLNSKQGTLTLTTTGTSGAATLVGSTLNIPAYSGSISGLTAGYIPQATSATAIGNSFIDYGVTTAGVYTSTKEIDGTIFKWNGGGTIGGGQDWIEGTAPTGVASDDLIYALASNHRIQMKLNAGSALNIPGIAAAGTSGHLAVLASNGIDIVDGGAVPAGGTPISGATNQIVRMTGASTAAGDSTFTSTGAGVQTFSTAITAAQSTITEGNTANTNGHSHVINVNTNQSANAFQINNQFGPAAFITSDGRLNIASLIAFNGIGTFADNQIPIITAASSHAAAAVTNGATNVTLISSATAGSYEVCGTLTVAAVGTAGTIALSMTYNNGAAQTLTASPATVLTTTAGNFVTIPCQVIRLASATALTYTVTGAALTGSPTIFRDVSVKVMSQP